MLTNLPTRNSNVEIECTFINEEHPSGYTKGWRVHTSNGYTICEICSTTPGATASAIANAITAARDVGFEQGVASVRKALGL